MAFSQADITDPKVRRADTDLIVSWSSSAAAGTVYQVYVNRVLSWSGTGLSARLPWPATIAYIDIGAVDDGVGSTDYSASLTSGSATRAELTWLGGTYLSADIDHYAIYSGTAPGGAISYAAPVARVPAYLLPVVTDGYGFGGYGQGGFGEAAASYAWTSRPLAPGVWSFAVVPVDVAGNAAGSPSTVNVTIVGPPNPPAPFPDGSRLAYTLSAGFGGGGFGGGGFGLTAEATLAWNASP